MNVRPRHSGFSGCRALVVGVSAALLAGTAGCGGHTFRSRWLDRPVTIDARTRDWADALETLEDEGMDVGAMNDGDSLYVCVVLGTRAEQLQAIRGGLTLWLDPAGGDAHALGVRFPVVADPPRGGRARPDEEHPRAVLEDAWRSLDRESELEVITGDDVREILPIDGSEGIALRAGEEHAQLVYELRIPLRSGRYALGVSKGAIGVGLETPKAPRPEARPDMSSGVGPGLGRPDRGEWDAPRGRGRRGGFERPDPIELWATLELAAPDGERP